MPSKWWACASTQRICSSTPPLETVAQWLLSFGHLQVYGSCRYLNGPLRKKDVYGPCKKPHPLPLTMSCLDKGAAAWDEIPSAR